jgi:hypothetical protein
MFKSYKVIELKSEDSFQKQSRKEQYEEVSTSFVGSLFNQKIGDFAYNFKELFIDRGSKEDFMFTKRSQEILIDSLDFFLVQFLDMEISESNLRDVVSNDIKLFPNLFAPLFKMYAD